MTKFHLHTPAMIMFSWVVGLAAGLSIPIIGTPRSAPLIIFTIILYLFFFWYLIKVDEEQK